jgi:hypothetical protein
MRGARFLTDLTEIDDVEILFGQAPVFWAAAVPSLRVPHLTSTILPILDAWTIDDMDRTLFRLWLEEVNPPCLLTINGMNE